MSKPLINKLQQEIDSGSLFSWIDECYSSSEVLRRIGYSVKGDYCSIVKNTLVANDVDISHFKLGSVAKIPTLEKTCPVCGALFKTKQNSREQTTCSYSCSNTYFRSGEDNPNYKNSPCNYRKQAFAYYKPVCNRCYFSNLLALEVHHVDRDRTNNSIENLEILCSNCHVIEHKQSYNNKIP